MPQKPQPDQCGQDIVSPTEGVDVTAQEKQAAHESYFHRDAVALDQDINVDTGGQLDVGGEHQGSIGAKNRRIG